MSLLDARTSKPLLGGPSFSLQNRIFRAVWNSTWFALAAWTPPQLHKWRVLLLRFFGADVDWSARVYGSARIWFPPNLTMKAHSVLGPRVNCYCMDKIEVGARAVISQGSHLCGGSHDIGDPNFQLITRPIYIGDDVWIAAEAFLGPGVRVGDGAVIGARSVLFKDAAAGGVFVGNPASCVRQRVVY